MSACVATTVFYYVCRDAGGVHATYRGVDDGEGAEHCIDCSQYDRVIIFIRLSDMQRNRPAGIRIVSCHHVNNYVSYAGPRLSLQCGERYRLKVT